MEERELPAGWVEVPLAELIDRIEAGKNFRCIERPPLNGEIGVVKVSAVSWGRFREEESKTVPPGIELDPETRIYEGDLLFSRANTIELVGACVLVDSLTKDLRLSDKILRLATLDELIKPWIYRYLSSPEARKYLSETSSGNQLSMRNISQKVLLETLVPVAPLNEQRRIAAKLDTTLAAVDACRQRLDGVAELLKRFRQAVLAAATSGELTREWREERGCDKVWKQTTIDQIAKVGTGSTPLRSNPAFYGSSGIPWITSAATSAELITSASEFVTEQGQAASRLRVYPKATLLVAMYGEGKTRGQVSELGIAATINQACAAIYDPIKAYLMPFIKIVLRANYLEMRDLAEGGNQPNLNLSKIKQFPIALPSKDEVFEICDRVETFFTLADQLEARLTSARRVVDRLTPALLTKAFRGELVPQDPNDEPASVLLERLRAARQAEAGAGKPTRRGRRKAAAHPDQPSLDAAPVPSDLLSTLLQECGALSERALLAASELEPRRFRAQLQQEMQAGRILEEQEDGEKVLVSGG